MRIFVRMRILIATNREILEKTEKPETEKFRVKCSDSADLRNHQRIDETNNKNRKLAEFNTTGKTT